MLLIHSLMFLLLDCGGSVFGPCLVMHYLPLLGVLYSCAIILTRKRERERESYFNCFPTINVL